MEYFEASSTVDANSNGRADIADWLIGGSTNYSGNLETSIETGTNGNVIVSWSPNIAGRAYYPEVNTNLTKGAEWISYGPVTDNSGKWVDTNVVENIKFYRVKVGLPEK